MTPYISQIEEILRRTPGSRRWHIRPVGQVDIYSLSEIITDSFHSRVGPMGWFYPFLQIGITEDLRHRLKSELPHYICLVAEEVTGNNPIPSLNRHPPIGTVEMALKPSHFFQRAHKQHYYLSNLAVQSKYRRQGVAQKLLAGCEQIALHIGLKDLYLHVLEDNYQAQRLYHKSGYHLEKVDPDWSSYLLRRPKRLLLRKHLTS
ncbi:hypothetical protein BST81_24210 [Leptolyngbya sp. 'hensonii']|nr:hypothetical protein BST81_24210 [Leptolyngbya sp. 'hensonii']